MLKSLPNTIFEFVDELDLYFSTDQDTHDSVKTIVSKLAHCQNLHTLKITVWIDTHIGKMFELLQKQDLHLYKTVKTL